MGGGGRPGRPESPLNPEAGPVGRLAAQLRQLRQLREDAGRPSYRQLAHTAHYSHSALSQAAAGRELPSLAVTLAFAKACGGDRQEWIARWEEAANAAGADTAAEARAAAGADTAAMAGTAVPGILTADAEPVAAALLDTGAQSARIRRARWRRPSMVGLAAVVTGGLLWAGLSLGWTTPDAIRSPARQPVGGLGAPVFDGAFPSAGGCYIGSGDLGSSSVRTGGGELLGMVELRYSRRCAAVWARFDPNTALSGAGPVMITVKVARRPDGRIEVSHARNTGKRQRSDILLLHAGCAQANVMITEAGRILAVATTACKSAP